MDELLEKAEIDSDDADDTYVPGASAPAASTAPLHAPSAPDLQADAANISIRITEFYPVDKKMHYVVETATTLTGFAKQNSKVVRKYEDFKWLAERLSLNADLAGIVVPALPAPVEWNSPPSAQLAQKVKHNAAGRLDEYQQRAILLERYLGALTRHTRLTSDTNFVVFLEDSKVLSPVSDSKSLLDMASALIKSGPSLKIDDNATCTSAVMAAMRYRTALVTATAAASKMTTAMNNLADTQTALEEAFLTCPLNAGNVTELLARGINRAESFISVRTDGQETHLTYLLHDYKAFTDGTLAMLNRRLGLLERRINTSKALEKATIKAQPANATPDKHALVLALKDEEAALKTSCTDATLLATQELARIRVQRTVDFKAAFCALAESQLIASKAILSSWQEFAAEIRRF